MLLILSFEERQALVTYRRIPRIGDWNKGIMNWKRYRHPSRPCQFHRRHHAGNASYATRGRFRGSVMSFIHFTPSVEKWPATSLEKSSLSLDLFADRLLQGTADSTPPFVRILVQRSENHCRVVWSAWLLVEEEIVEWKFYLFNYLRLAINAKRWAKEWYAGASSANRLYLLHIYTIKVTIGYPVLGSSLMGCRVYPHLGIKTRHDYCGHGKHTHGPERKPAP